MASHLFSLLLTCHFVLVPCCSVLIHTYVDFTAVETASSSIYPNGMPWQDTMDVHVKRFIFIRMKCPQETLHPFISGLAEGRNSCQLVGLVRGGTRKRCSYRWFSCRGILSQLQLYREWHAIDNTSSESPLLAILLGLIFKCLTSNAAQS